MRSTILRPIAFVSVLAAGVSFAPRSHATSGAHAPAISTFDTRASSIVVAARSGFSDTTWRAFSYNANFTSTSGNFSAQFGVHYLQIREPGDDTLLHGAAASGAGVFNVPLSSRFDNGVPMVAFNLYGGAVPTAAVSGPRNFISLPITIGVGTSLSPVSWLTFTPRFELAPSGTLDTRLRQPNLDELTGVDSSTVDVTQLTPEQVQELQGQELFTEEDVNKVIDDSVDIRFSIHLAMRAGLMITARLGERVSFNLDAGVLGYGPAFADAVVGYAGGGFVLHWDDIVPAVLPASRRLREESCEDIETRFRACPAGVKLFSAAPATKRPPAAMTPLKPAPTAPASSAPSAVPPAKVTPIAPAAEPAPAVIPAPAPAPTGDVTPAPTVPASPAPAPEALPNRASPYDTKPPSASFPK